MIIKVDSHHPSKRAILRAAHIIKQGGLVIFPTETVYGLGADAFNTRAVAKIFRVKGRPKGKPLIVHVSKKSTIDALARDVPPVARKLVKKFWPGPLTLVFQARASILTLVSGRSAFMLHSMKAQHSTKCTVAIRMPDHPVALALIRAAGPLAAPSANFSGQKPPRSVREIPYKLLQQVDLVLDAGRCSVGVPSTVLDLTAPEPKILRHGAISRDKLKRTGFFSKP